MISFINKINLLSKKQLLLVVLIFTASVYLPTLWNQYNIDDEFFTLNKWVTDAGWKGIPHLLQSGYTFGDIEYSYGYRPMSLITYNITYTLFGENVMLHHLINLMFYLMLIAMFWQVLSYFIEDTKYLLFIVLLFAVHPLHTEVVANLKSRDILLAYLFLMMMMRCILIYVQTNRSSHKWLSVLSLIILLLLSFISHPIAILFVPVLLLFYFFTDQNRPISQKVLYILLFGILSGVLLFLVNKSIHSAVPMTLQTDRFINENPFYYNRFPMERYLSNLYWWAYTIWISFIPWKLCHFYGFGALDTYDELSLLEKLSTIFTLLLLLYLFVKYSILSFGKMTKMQGLFAFSFFTFFIFSAAQSNLYRLMPGIIAERWIFMNALFPVVFIVVLLSSKIKTSGLFFSILGLWLLFWSIQSFDRCKDWYDREQIEAVDLESFPRNAKLLLNAGTYHLEKYKKNLSSKTSYNLSKNSYLLATQVLPQYAEAFNNIGVLEQYNNQIDSAKKYYKLSVEADSNYFLSTNNLAIIYGQEGDTTGLLKLYKSYISKNEDSYEGYNSLIVTLINLKRLDEALSWIEQGLISCPHKRLQFLDLKGGVLWEQGAKELALKAWQEALSISPENRILQEKINRGKQLL